MNKLFKKIAGLVIGLTMAIGVGAAIGGVNAKGVSAASPVTLTYSTFNMSGTAYVTKSATVDGTTFNVTNCNVNNGLNMKASGEIYNSTEMAGNITSIDLYNVKFSSSSGAGFYVYGGESSKSTTSTLLNNSGDTTSPLTVDFSSHAYKYFFIKNKTSRTCAFSSIVIYYSSGTKYTVSFDANNDDYTGSTPADITQSSVGASITLPSALSCTGYTWLGWNTSSSGGQSTRVNSPYTPSSNHVLYGEWSKNVYTVTPNITNGSLDDSSSIEHGEDLMVQILPDDGYRYPSMDDVTIMMGSTNITEESYDPVDGTILYENVTGNIVVTATCPPDAQSYNVSWDDSENVTISGSSTIYVDTRETYTITANDGYKLPDSDSVTVSGADYDYDKTQFDSATLVLSNPTSDVSITVVGVELATYTVEFKGSNYTHTELLSIQEYGSEDITLTANAHFDLPDSVSVDGATHDYTKSTGKLTISNPTSNVEITVNPVARERYTISVVGDGEYSNKFSYSGDTEIYQYEEANLIITPVTETGSVYVIDSDHITVSNAEKVSYDQSSGALKINKPSANVTITVTPVLKVLQRIDVTTNPSKTTYNSGDDIDTSGLVVTATYTTGNEIVPLSQLTYSTTKAAVVGSSGTAVTQTVYVYYGGKSTYFEISVTPVTLGASWTLVSDTSSLENGDKVIIAASGYNYALSTTQNDNNRGQASITKSGSTAKLGDGVQELTLNVVTGGYEFYTGSGYLYAASSSNNYLKTQTTNNANGVWAISFSDNVASIVATGTNKRNVMQYNSGSSCFAAYASASQKSLALYRKIEASSTPVAITSSFNGSGSDHSDGETINKADFPTTLIYNNGSQTNVTADSVTPSTFKEGSNVYTVSYSSYTYNVLIEGVRAAKKMIGIEIDTTNVTKAFTVGSTFNYDGLIVYGVYDNDDREVIPSGYTVSTPDMTTVGKKTVTVSYQTFESKTYEIEVSNTPIMNIVEGAVIDGYEGESYNLIVELLNFTGTPSWSLNPSSSSYYSIEVKTQTYELFEAVVTLDTPTEEDLSLEISEANSGADPVEISISIAADYVTEIVATTSILRYDDGDVFDKDSVTVIASYAASTHEDEEIDVDECTLTAVNSKAENIDLEEPLPIEEYTVTVEYQGKTDSFEFSVTMPEGLVLCVATEIPGKIKWQKVAKNEAIVSGAEYQFVYETDDEKARFFNNKDEANGYIEYDIPESGNIIETTENPLPSVTLTSIDGGYSIKCNGGADKYNGKYICGKSGSNSIEASDTAVAVAFEFTEDNGQVIALSNSTSFRYNAADNNNRFRFFKTSTTGNSYIYPYLYKKVKDPSTYTYEEQDMTLGVYEFLKAGNEFVCDSTGNTFDKDAWDVLRGKYQSLLTDDKAQLDNAVISGGGYTSDEMYVKYITRYDFIVGKYGSDYDFMKRGISSGSRNYNLAKLGDIETSILIIGVLGLVSLTAIGSYFYIRRRKENQ